VKARLLSVLNTVLQDPAAAIYDEAAWEGVELADALGG